jgi:glyoxylase-like metal-dependent hydrolase (beta-lactamase superfamily II)
MAVEHTKSWTVGDVRITRIYELSHQTDCSFLLPDATAEMVKKYEWLRPHFATAEGQIISWFQAFVVTFGKRRIMVDTSVGNDKIREFELFAKTRTSFLEDLAAVGCPPETIDTVVCTHLDIDHVGWNTRLVEGRWEPTFPNARYLFGRAEWEYAKTLLQEKPLRAQHLVDSVLPILDAGLADLVEPDHRVADELWLEPTPGHTPGHASVHIASRGHHAVITGDILHHPFQLAEPDLPSAYCIDGQLACKTRRAFLSRYEDRKALLIGTHFPDPTAGWIIRDAHNWRFSCGESAYD